jgi:hypothetical protein
MKFTRMYADEQGATHLGVREVPRHDAALGPSPEPAVPERADDRPRLEMMKTQFSAELIDSSRKVDFATGRGQLAAVRATITHP